MNTLFRNLLTTLRRFKLASSLNIIGLSVAYAAFMVIIMQVYYEYSFDTQSKNSDRICRINSHGKLLNNGVGVVVSPRPFLEVFSDVPAVEQATLIEPAWAKSYVTVENNGTKAGFNEKITYAYENFPAFFDLHLIDGSAANYRDNRSAIIPRSLALKFFGTPYAAGRSINIHGTETITIAAVFEDFAKNSQLGNNIYRYFPTDLGVDQWGSSNYLIYVCLVPNMSVTMAENQMNRADIKTENGWIDSISLSALESIYFDPEAHYGDEMLVKKGDRDTTDILLAIAILIIVIAGINFVNFSTSLAPMRMKNINTQKVLGSPTSTLRFALIGEAVGISLIAFAVAIIWIWALMDSPWQGITISGISFAGNGALIALSGVLAVVVGLMAGIYPAFYTTKFPPALVLKGSFAMSKRGKQLRTALVGFQFVISIGLIIGAIFLQLQNQYLRTMDKGFKSERIIVATLGGEILNNTQTFENRLKENPAISDIGYCQFELGVDNMMQGWARQFKAGAEQQNFGALLCSWNLPQVLGIEFLDGEPLQKTDINSENVPLRFIFNKTAQDKIGFNVGDKLDATDSTYNLISGVVRDFNFKTMRMAVEPMALVVKSSDIADVMHNAYIRTQGDPMAAINHIKNVTRSIDPTYPSKIYFYDESFEQLYAQDLKTTSLIMFFSMLAIIISLVGVFGLVVFETQYRRREIGLRKIYGSTITQILAMFNRKFIWIVAICFIIATPMAYFGVTLWLENFAYRTPIYAWVFLLSLAIVLTITLVTVTVQSYRAATENPIRSIKSE